MASAIDGPTAIGLPGSPDFPGFGPAAYRINSDGSLAYADAPHSTAPSYPDNAKVIQITSIHPKYMNAPAALFEGQSKVGSYLRLQVQQTDDLLPLKSLLAWTTYPQLNTAPQQDFGSKPVAWTSADDEAMSGITLANAQGALSLTLYAVVGPPAKDIWTVVDSTFQKLMGIAQQEQGTALALPAADLVLASLVESQIGDIVLAFEPTTTQQVWIVNDPITFLFAEPANGTLGNGTGVLIPDATPTTIILVPSSSNPGDQKQLQAAVNNNKPTNPNYDPHYPSWEFDPQGSTSYQTYLEPFMSGGTTAGSYQFDASGRVLTTTKDSNKYNPLDYVPYVTLSIVARASSTANPTG